MTSEHLTAILAERIMGWSVGPDRYMMGARRWMPRWRFQPAKNIADALRLLQSASPQAFSITDDNGKVSVQVQIGAKTGEAHGTSKAEAITLAVARAVGVEVGQ